MDSIIIMIGQIITYSINSCLFINIEKVTQSISVLYFTDENNIKINIPNGTIMYDYADNHKFILNPIPYTQSYALCYTDKYELRINGVRMNIINTRDVSVLP